ncbi:MAG: alanine racemase [Nocardioidaceae bacterium]
MSLTLHVDEQRWRANLAKVAGLAYVPGRGGVVPVAKGNGYGFGLARLAGEANTLRADGLGVDTLAVGTYDELDAVADFTGDAVVLNPWRPFAHRVGDQLIHTVGRLVDLEQVQGRVLLERMTSMKRHGFSAAELKQAADLARERGLQVEGVSIHLPLGGGYAEAEQLVLDAIAADVHQTIWVSHLSAAELTRLREHYADISFRPRIGTELWLGDRGALSVSATVLDVHPIKRGERFGYRGRKAPRSGWIVIASGGTAHGIGLTAPAAISTARGRAATLAKGGLEASGRLRSPYWLGDQQLLFAEPPHMQSSMLFLAGSGQPVAVSDALAARVRYTTTSFDRISFD